MELFIEEMKGTLLKDTTPRGGEKQPSFEAGLSLNIYYQNEFLYESPMKL